MNVDVTDHRNDSPVRLLVDSLKSSGILYCHWKSNEHLEAGIIGDTDLDVLFRPEDEKVVETLLTQLGFKRFESVWFRSYPGVRDYIALNPRNGKLLHVHAHFALLIGESGVKNFILPWGNDYISRSNVDPSNGFVTAAPAEELLVLMIRAAIKKRFPTPIQWPMKRNASSELSDDMREFIWLKERASRHEMEEVATLRLGPQSTESVLSLYQNEFSEAHLLNFYHANRALLTKFRRTGAIAALARRWTRRIASLGGRVVSRTGPFVVPTRHTASNGGMIVAILGSDGAGKSTLLKGLKDSLSTKIDVTTLYLGSGTGKSGLLRLPLIMMRRIFGNRPDGKPGSNTLTRARSRKTSLLHTAFDFLWAVALANEKKQKLRFAERTRRRGILVITDRYPQTSVPRWNDAPLLSELKNSQWRLMRAIARWEHRCYDHKCVPQPNIVLKLSADPAILLKRRPEMDLEFIKLKQDVSLKTKFPSQTRVVHLDASRSPADLLNAALFAIMSEFTASDKVVR